MAEVAVRLVGVHKHYGDVVAVDGIDLEVFRGECFGLLGPNGAGKTTTLEIIEGLLPQNQGEVSVFGLTWAHDAQRLRARLGVALQENSLFDRLSVSETLRLFRSFYDQGYSPAELIELLKLAEKRDTWVMRLSGGQRQRLALGCALVGKPELLILDEPTTGLDPQSRRTIWDLVRQLRAAGTTVLLTSHYMDEAETLCDRIAIIDHGRVIALGTPAELIDRLASAHVIELESEPGLPSSVLETLPGAKQVRPNGQGWLINADAMHVVLPKLVETLSQQGSHLTRLSARDPTLEDVFVELTGRHLREG